MNHMDLFSGIGGFAYAVDQVWPGSTHTFCDNNLFCQKVLAKHWPESKIYGDIRTITNTTGDRLARKWPSVETKEGLQPRSEPAGELEGGSERPYSDGYDLLTGGFPCQPFSQAGKRRGTDDNRYLWPEMLRVIRLTKPRWIIGENVGGFITWNEGMVLEKVWSDLEGEGYEVQPFIIPAIAVNAPHRRDRVWIVANRQSERSGRSASQERSDGKEWQLEQDKQKRSEVWGQSEGRAGWNENWFEVATRLCGVFNGLSRELDENIGEKYAKTTNKIQGQDLPCLWQGFQSGAIQWKIGRFDSLQEKDYVFTVLWKLSKISKGQVNLPFESKIVQDAYLRNMWVNEKLGCPPQGWEYQEQYAKEHQDSLSSLSYEIALATLEIWQNYSAGRVDRLRALGNAIVPQVAIEIMKAIRLANGTGK